MSNIKQCQFCSIAIPLRGTPGYTGLVCKSCYNTKRRARWQSDPAWREKISAINKQHPKKSVYKRHSKLKARYGIDIEEYNRILRQQNSVCAICHQPETRKGATGESVNLSVDHNHNSGRVRALLCHECNVLIGACKESATILVAAKDYLDHYSV